MTAALGPLFLLLLSVLLGAALLLMIFGFIVWVTLRQRQGQADSEGNIWERNATDLTGRDASPFAAPGK